MGLPTGQRGVNGAMMSELSIELTKESEEMCKNPEGQQNILRFVLEYACQGAGLRRKDEVEASLTSKQNQVEGLGVRRSSGSSPRKRNRRRFASS